MWGWVREGPCGPQRVSGEPGRVSGGRALGGGVGLGQSRPLRSGGEACVFFYVKCEAIGGF